jgi:hypothetical protein
MEKRQKKQIIIASVYFAIFGLILTGVFLAVKPAPSPCLDQARQCDGPNPPCPPCELFDLKPFEIIWKKAFPVGVLAGGGFNYDIAAQVRNPNLSWGAASFEYKFEAFDSAGEVLGGRSGKSFIMPAADTILIENNFSSQRPIARLEVSFTPVLEINWQKLKNLAGFDLKSRNVVFRYLKPPETGFAELTGLAINASDFSFQHLTVKAAILGANREALAVNKTELFTVAGGEERFFKLTWPFQFSGEAVQQLVLVETDVFSDENFLRRYSQ